jgi:purine-cytosine permease-like protein
LIWRAALSIGLLSDFIVAMAGAAEATRKVITSRDSFGPGGSNIQSILVVVRAHKAR